MDGEAEERVSVSDELIGAWVDLSGFAAYFNATHGHRGGPVIEFSWSGRAFCRYDRQVNRTGVRDDECVRSKNADQA